MIRQYLHIIFGLSMLGLACNQKTQQVDNPTYAIFSEIEYSIIAGQIAIPIADIPDGDISIIITGIHGVSTLKVSDGKLHLPSEISNKAGIYTLYANKGLQIIDQTSLKIKSRTPQGKILTYLGPKTTAFNDSPGTMLTSIVTDTFDNMINKPIEFEYRFLGKKGAGIKIEQSDHEYFAYKTFPPYNNDKVLVGLKGPNELYSVELPLEGSSGCADKATINIPLYYPIADGRQQYTVEIDNIKDIEGYNVADGTHLSIYIKSPNQSQKYESISVNGSSTFQIENPKTSDNLSITVYSCGNPIAKLPNIKFEPSVSKLHSVWLSSNELRIGPITNNLNQSLPNGSPLDITILDCDDYHIPTMELYDGFVTLNLDDVYTKCPIEKLKVDLGGKQLLIQVNKSEQ